MKINEKNLCVFASMPPYDCEGFLSKRGEINKAFQRRYFVLKGNLLFYFEKKGDKEPLGLIIVEGCTIEMSQECDPYCFEIVFKDKRTYVLSADTQESMETWMKVLTCAGYEFKKLTIEKLQEQLSEIETAREKMLGENAAATASVTAPRPPPRIRTNPFDTIRPAPPVPLQHKEHSIGPADMVVVNGHFGSVSPRPQLTNKTGDSSGNNSPVPPPRRNTPALSAAAANTNNNAQLQVKSSQQIASKANSSKSVFYPEIDSYTNATARAISVPTSTASLTPKPSYSSGSTTVAPTTAHCNKSFEQVHEKFRPIVMRDVLNYRAKTAKPLIDI